MVIQKVHKGLYWFRASVLYVQCEEESRIIVYSSACSRSYKRVAREGMCPRPRLNVTNETLLVLMALLTKQVVR